MASYIEEVLPTMSGVNKLSTKELEQIASVVSRRIPGVSTSDVSSFADLLDSVLQGGDKKLLTRGRMGQIAPLLMVAGSVFMRTVPRALVKKIVNVASTLGFVGKVGKKVAKAAVEAVPREQKEIKIPFEESQKSPESKSRNDEFDQLTRQISLNIGARMLRTTSVGNLQLKNKWQDMLRRWRQFLAEHQLGVTQAHIDSLKRWVKNTDPHSTTDEFRESLGQIAETMDSTVKIFPGVTVQGVEFKAPPPLEFRLRQRVKGKRPKISDEERETKAAEAKRIMEEFSNMDFKDFDETKVPEILEKLKAGSASMPTVARNRVKKISQEILDEFNKGGKANQIKAAHLLEGLKRSVRSGDIANKELKRVRRNIRSFEPKGFRKEAKKEAERAVVEEKKASALDRLLMPEALLNSQRRLAETKEYKAMSPEQQTDALLKLTRERTKKIKEDHPGDEEKIDAATRDYAQFTGHVRTESGGIDWMATLAKLKSFVGEAAPVVAGSAAVGAAGGLIAGETAAIGAAGGAGAGLGAVLGGAAGRAIAPPGREKEGERVGAAVGIGVGGKIGSAALPFISRMLTGPKESQADQESEFQESAKKLRPGRLRPKFISPSVDILEPTVEESRVDETEYALFDYVRPGDWGAGVPRTNALVAQNELNEKIMMHNSGGVDKFWDGGAGFDLPSIGSADSERRATAAGAPRVKFMDEVSKEPAWKNPAQEANTRANPYKDYSKVSELERDIKDNILFGVCP